MAIASWLLGIVAFYGYVWLLMGWPRDVLLAAGLAGLLLGGLSFLSGKKVLLHACFVLLFLGVAATYARAQHAGLVWLWIAGAAAQVFFGSLTLRA